MKNAKDKVYEAIKNYMFDFNYPPTIREISELSKVKSISYVYECLDILRDEGKLDFIDGKSRTITIPGVFYIEKGAR